MSVNPSAGFLMNGSLPRINEKLSFQIESDIGRMHFYCKEKTEKFMLFEYNNVDFNALSLKGLTSFKYTYPRGKLRPAINLGFGFNYIIKPDSHRELIMEFPGSITSIDFENDMPMVKFLWAGLGRIGFDYHINNKLILFLSASYVLCGNSIEDRNIHMRISSLSINSGVYF
ncbi:MAG: hypothetical protein AMS27_17985 [Bacteroides sp. SM23_62_1]|nr:MAG: hypothetical protein AMS27_17985 [Bacteroides sp. SM23_62_1]